LLIQGRIKYKELEKKIYQCEYAYQTYAHLLNEVKDILRSGEFNNKELYIKMQTTDDFIYDNTPLVDYWFKQFDEKLTY